MDLLLLDELSHFPLISDWNFIQKEDSFFYSSAHDFLLQRYDDCSTSTQDIKNDIENYFERQGWRLCFKELFKLHGKVNANERLYTIIRGQISHRGLLIKQFNTALDVLKLLCKNVLRFDVEDDPYISEYFKHVYSLAENQDEYVRLLIESINWRQNSVTTDVMACIRELCKNYSFEDAKQQFLHIHNAYAVESLWITRLYYDIWLQACSTFAEYKDLYELNCKKLQYPEKISLSSRLGELAQTFDERLFAVRLLQDVRQADMKRELLRDMIFDLRGKYKSDYERNELFYNVIDDENDKAECLLNMLDVVKSADEFDCDRCMTIIWHAQDIQSGLALSDACALLDEQNLKSDKVYNGLRYPRKSYFLGQATRPQHDSLIASRQQVLRNVLNGSQYSQDFCSTFKFEFCPLEKEDKHIVVEWLTQNVDKQSEVEFWIGEFG